jgi:hypothetical protein
LSKNINRTSLNRTVEYGRNTASRWSHLYQ